MPIGLNCWSALFLQEASGVGAEREALLAINGLVWTGDLELDIAMSLRNFLQEGTELDDRQVVHAIGIFLPRQQADLVLQKMQLAREERQEKIVAVSL